MPLAVTPPLRFRLAHRRWAMDKEELDRRLSRYESHPGELLTLDELKERIETRK